MSIPSLEFLLALFVLVAADIVKTAAESGRSLREVALEQGVEPSVLEQALDHRRMARPHE